MIFPIRESSGFGKLWLGLRIGLAPMRLHR